MYCIDEILAAHSLDGEMHLLALWEGHSIPTWVPADGIRDNPYTLKDLDPGKTEEELQYEIGPSAFTMYCGDVPALRPCAISAADENHIDGSDDRLYVDASKFGNVRLSRSCFYSHYSEKQCR